MKNTKRLEDVHRRALIGTNITLQPFRWLRLHSSRSILDQSQKSLSTLVPHWTQNGRKIGSRSKIPKLSFNWRLALKAQWKHSHHYAFLNMPIPVNILVIDLIVKRKSQHVYWHAGGLQRITHRHTVSGFFSMSSWCSSDLSYHLFTINLRNCDLCLALKVQGIQELRFYSGQ